MAIFNSNGKWCDGSFLIWQLEMGMMVTMAWCFPAGPLRNRPVNAAWSTQEIDNSQIIFAMWSYLIIFDHI